jgi:hypothetical protein
MPSQEEAPTAAAEMKKEHEELANAELNTVPALT